MGFIIENSTTEECLGVRQGSIMQPSITLDKNANRITMIAGGKKLILDDGFPSRLVGPEPNIPRITNEKDRDRVSKLRALGNAIVPQVAHQIIEKIAMIELGKCRPIDSSSAEEPSIVL